MIQQKKQGLLQDSEAKTFYEPTIQSVEIAILHHQDSLNQADNL